MIVFINIFKINNRPCGKTNKINPNKIIKIKLLNINPKIVSIRNRISKKHAPTNSETNFNPILLAIIKLFEFFSSLSFIISSLYIKYIKIKIYLQIY